MSNKREVTRIEGFSDAVFGFALTLLVVSLEVPENITGLRETLNGFLPFAASFTMICWIWYEHYRFYRLIGHDDAVTITLNCALLFVVLFFVYPLKFITRNLFAEITGIGSHDGFVGLSESDVRLLMASYGGGFVIVFAIFALLYHHALKRNDPAVDVYDRFDSQASMRRSALSVAVGLLAVVAALVVPARYTGLTGLIYMLQGPVQTIHGYLSGKERAKILPSSN